MQKSLLCGSVILSSISVGCAAATGAVEGGDPLFDAASQATVMPEAGGATTNNPAPQCQQGGMYGGNTWTDLYQCYFGPTGPDSCAGQSGQAASCHGTGGAGAMAAWVCGETMDSCYMGMKNYMVLDPTQNTSDPTMSGLYNVLCQVNGMGAMPLGCTPSSVQLYPDDMARVAAWIKSGGQEN